MVTNVWVILLIEHKYYWHIGTPRVYWHIGTPHIYSDLYSIPIGRRGYTNDNYSWCYWHNSVTLLIYRQIWLTHVWYYWRLQLILLKHRNYTTDVWVIRWQLQVLIKGLFSQFLIHLALNCKSWLDSVCGRHAVSAVPCTPAAVRVDYTCGTSMAVLSWNESLGRENFIARIQTQDHSDSCTSNQTRCSLSSLLCGRVYNVSVRAVAGQCNSSDVARTQMQTGNKMNANALPIKLNFK